MTFYYKRSWLWLVSIFGALLIAWFILIDPPEGIFDIAFWGLIVFLVPLFSYLALFIWKYHIELGENFFQVHSLPHPAVKPIRHRYANIAHLNRGWMRGLLKVTFHDGKSWLVSLDGLEGKPNDFFTELAKHVEPQRIEPGLPHSLWRYTWPERLQIPVLIVFGLTTFCNLYFTAGHRLVRSYIAWRPVTKVKVSAKDIQAYYFGADNSPWLIEHSFISDRYQIKHLLPGGTSQWELRSVPAAVIGEWKYRGAFGLGADRQGNPWVLFSHGAMYWDGQTWQAMVFQNEVSDRLYGGRIAIADSQLWYLGSPNTEGGATELFSVDLDSRALRPVPLPASASGKNAEPIELRQMRDTLYVLARQDNLYQIYSFREGHWQAGPRTEFYSEDGPVDFAVDPQEQMWVMVEMKNGEVYTIGKSARVGDEMIWYLAFPKQRHFDALTVDGRERVWLQGNEFDQNGRHQNYILEVYAPTADGTLQPVIAYTPQNSGYQDNYEQGIALTADGRLWSGRETLAWIDGNQIDLPKPLPTWAAYAENSNFQTIWLAWYAFVSLIYLIMSGWFFLKFIASRK